MRTWQVDDVMTRDVATVEPLTPYRKVVDLVTSRRINAVPVVDSAGRVLGVVSETDLLYKVELIGEPHDRRMFEGRRSRDAKVKADAMMARDLMTAPPITTYAASTVVEAARTMDHERVKSLPVVDDLGRLVGIVSRGDLLKVHLRPDADIRRDVVEDIFRRVLAVREGVVTVEVVDGTVRLAGALGGRGAVEIAARLTANVSGVVAVVNELTYDVDDTVMADTGSGFPVGIA